MSFSCSIRNKEGSSYDFKGGTFVILHGEVDSILVENSLRGSEVIFNLYCKNRLFSNIIERGSKIKLDSGSEEVISINRFLMASVDFEINHENMDFFLNNEFINWEYYKDRELANHKFPEGVSPFDPVKRGLADKRYEDILKEIRERGEGSDWICTL